MSAGKRANLLSAVWRGIETEFVGGDWPNRYHVMEVVKEAAYFQPEAALRIVRAALHLLVKSRKRKSFAILGPQHVLRMVPEVLRRVGFIIEFLPECCQLLWLIGRGDARALNPFPEHAIRVLQDLASYKTTKPPQFNRIILECVIGWLDDPQLHAYTHSPFTIVDKLLEKKGESTWTEGAMVIISPFLVSAESTKAIRERAIEALSNSAQTAHPDIALRSLESLRVSDTFELRFIQALMSEPLVPRPRRSPRSDIDWDKRMEEDEAERARFRVLVARECKRRFANPKQLLKVMNHWLQQLESAGCSTWPNHVRATSLSANPIISIAILCSTYTTESGASATR